MLSDSQSLSLSLSLALSRPARHHPTVHIPHHTTQTGRAALGDSAVVRNGHRASCRSSGLARTQHGCPLGVSTETRLLRRCGKRERGGRERGERARPTDGARATMGGPRGSRWEGSEVSALIRFSLRPDPTSSSSGRAKKSQVLFFFPPLLFFFCGHFCN